MNSFIKALQNNAVRTANGAASNATTHSGVLDYFAECGSYRNRTQEEVNADMAKIFSDDVLMALKVLFYNRMITRKVQVGENLVTQKGQGQRDEFVKSIKWLERNYPELLYKNLWLIPVVGRWSDLWYDSANTNLVHYVNAEKVYELVKMGLDYEQSRGLIAKYLPKIRSKSNCKNDRHKRVNQWAKGLCKHFGWSEKDYRKFKSDPNNTAHLFQRQICDKKFADINFSHIPGKALFNLTVRKGKDGKNLLERHGLEAKYLDWVKKQPTAKFTGYPYELYKEAKDSTRSLVKKITLDKQFEGLLQLAKDQLEPKMLERGVLCALDTSASMRSFSYHGTQNTKNLKFGPIDVCVGLGIYFSSLIQGAFKDHVVMFNSQSRMVKLNGTFCDKVDQIRRHPTAWGGTNFQSIIDEIVRVKKQNPHIPAEEYPQILMVVSDMQFDQSATNMSNYQDALRKLDEVGLSEMTFVWWNVNGQGNEVPSTMNDAGTVLISGFDGAIVTSILGGEQKVVDKVTGQKRSLTPYEQMVKALDQPVLNELAV